MKKSLFWSMVLIVALSVVTIPGFAAEPITQRTIQASGDAEVKVVPDQVVLSLHVQTTGKDLSNVKQLNDEKVKKIITLIKTYQIDPKYVQTDQILIQPQYKEVKGENVLIGYSVDKSMVITLNDVSKFENLFSDIITAGANYVSGIAFGTTELRKYKDQARKLALIAAREKAVAMAGEYGLRIKRPLTISEEPVFDDTAFALRRQINISANASSGATSNDNTFVFGQISVRAKVTVVFELE